jgi:glycosyltransferase involved in cell wall biosynthesis
VKNLPAVSVVIPSFNRPEFTLRAVQSAVAQTWTDLEVLVIDDGSQPDRVYPEQKIDDRRVSLIRHWRNLGVSAARNTGVAAARAPVIALLDSDDRWLPQKLAIQMELFQRQPVPENVLLYSSYFIEEGGRLTVHPLIPRTRNQPISEFLFLNGGSFGTSTILASRTLLQQFPFDPTLSQAEDYDVYLRLEEKGVEFVRCPTPASITNKDLRGDRLSTKFNKNFYSGFLEINRHRLTPRSYVVLESIIANSDEELSTSSRLKRHAQHFLRSKRLHLFGRIRLIWSYLLGRCRAKWKLRRQIRRGGAVAA